MDYLQYSKSKTIVVDKATISFKPYYKWITFNTHKRNGKETF